MPIKKSLILSVLFFIGFVAKSQEKNHRDSINVLHYAINLDLSKLSTKQLNGRTDITFVSVFGNKTLVKFDFEGLVTDEIKLKNKSLKFSQTADVLSINLNSQIAINDTVTISIFYHGSPKHDKSWGGFFIASDYAYNYGVGMEATPPNYGRVWYPCIDNFTDRATYDYYVKTSNKYKAACPGLLQSVDNQDEETKNFHWKMNQSIPTYLSSVAVGDYIVIKDTVKGIDRIIPIELYVNSDQEKQAIITFENVKSFFHAFESRFGPYRWDKIGYVSTPFEQGAMEHATNIAYSKYCNGTSSCESTLAHELSHHWFGDLVTCRTEKDMWLNEGWARYCEAIYYEYKDGKIAYKDQIRKNHAEVLNWAQLNPNSFGALYGMPHSETYGSVVYNKGGDVAHTLRGQMGDSLFFSSLKNYFKAYAFKDVSVADFKDILSRNSLVDLTDFFDFWIYNPGFPHFSINKFTLEQKDFKYILQVEILQRLINTNKFAKSTKLEIGVLDKNLKMTKFPVVIDGESVTKSIELNFEPYLVMLDPDEKVSDATTDEYMVITEKSTYDFNSELFSLSINRIEKPIFFRITQNWINPLNQKINPNFNKFEDKYWEIQFTDKDSFNAGGYFYLPLDKNLYDNLGTQKLQNIKLFYRKNNQEEWLQVNSEIQVQNGTVYFYVNDINNGQYAFASVK